MAIYFIRHGESQANADGVHDGQRLDSSLTEKGRKQAKVTAEKAKSDGLIIERIISSPLKRAKETAIEFSKTFDIEVETDDRLKEYDMGLASGMSVKGTDNDYKTNNPKSEKVEDFQRRIMDFLAEIEDLKQNILIIGHGGIARIIRYSTMKDKPKNMYSLNTVANSRVLTLDQVRQS